MAKFDILIGCHCRWLTYNLGHYEYESMGLPAMSAYDVQLVSSKKKFTLGIKGVFNEDPAFLSHLYNVRLDETFISMNGSQWEMVNVKLPRDGKLVSRSPTKHEFIKCLQTMTGIWIRGSYFAGSEASWLKNISIIEGALNKGGETAPVQTLVNGTLVNSSATSPPSASQTCCTSRTCVSNDYYEIVFDRPGCMQAPDAYCCMAADCPSNFKRSYDRSTAAQIIQGTDYNEGRPYFVPPNVDRCKGGGIGQYESGFSRCSYDSTGPGLNEPASWTSATKNQNVGVKAIPIRMPFVKDYYFGSVPEICSAASLTVEAQGDIASPGTSIHVYGEDGAYLGALFSGNLSYMYEGQYPYNAYGPETGCTGLPADPNNPLGYRPEQKGYRGGRNDVVQPGVYGKENTQCKPWMPGNDMEGPVQFSESTPFLDTIAISQDRIMQYSADGQIKFTFRSFKDGSVPNTFTGVGGGGTTFHCNFGSGSNDCGNNAKCIGCELDGKVIFRSLRLKFTAGICYTKKAATDHKFYASANVPGSDPLNISVTYRVPPGSMGSPSGDASFSVTVGADIFSLNKYISVYDENFTKIGDLFRKESFESLRSHMQGNPMYATTSFGPVPSPIPFVNVTNCDTTSPVAPSHCIPADNRWTMGKTVVNYTDTLRIPRDKLINMTANDQIKLYLYAPPASDAFSQNAEGATRISPLILSFPLMHCFMRSINSGPYIRTALERPNSYFFKQPNFPLPAGDVTIFVAATWQKHVRYVTRHVGKAVTSQFAYDGVEDGLSVMRVDKDTVSDMGSMWVYKNSDGTECCPQTHRPDNADATLQVSAYSNCITNDCVDPDLSTLDNCTADSPCASGLLLSLTSTQAQLSSSASSMNNIYVGMRIYFSGPLVSLTQVNNGTTCTTAGTLIFTNGGGTGAAGTYTVSGGQVSGVTLVNKGIGYTSAPTISFSDSSCNAVVTADILSAAGLSATITGYNGATKTALLYPTLSQISADEYNYRISADDVSDFARNSRDGGTSTGSIALALDPQFTCTTGNLHLGYIETRYNQLVRLDSSASTYENAYVGYEFRILAAQNTWETHNITAYAGVYQGTVSQVFNSSVIQICKVVTCGGFSVQDFYVGVQITVDIDGNPSTGDDIYTRTVAAYSSEYVLTFDSPLGQIPTSSATYIIFARMATIGSIPSDVTSESLVGSSGLNLPNASSLGDTYVILATQSSAVQNYYTGMIIEISEDSYSQQYVINSYTSSRLAYLDRPLERAFTVNAVYKIYRPFSIYESLVTDCLQNVELRVTYTYGTAKVISNDPGAKLSIYSSWDSATGRSNSISPRNVEAWVLKLAGDGYYSQLYPSDGLAGFKGSVLEYPVAADSTIFIVQDANGIIPNMYLKLTDKGNLIPGSPKEEIVQVTAVVYNEGSSSANLTVVRAQLQTQAQSWTNHYAFGYAYVEGPAGFNQGEGMDQMQLLGGISRPSASTNDAYTGLYVTIEQGTGAGQTRLIDSYHGASRTVYVSEPWQVIPDATSIYRIWYTAEIQEYYSASAIAIATFPRPIKKGYVYDIKWHSCSKAIPASYTNVYDTSELRDGLPECRGTLGTRYPRQGPPVVYQRFTVLETNYITGSVVATQATASSFYLDSNAAVSKDSYVGRQITLSTSVASVNVAGSMSGCTENGRIIFQGGGGSGALATYTVSGGQITAVTMVAAGGFYIAAPSARPSEPSCVGYDLTVILKDTGSAIGETRTILRSSVGTPQEYVMVDTAFSSIPTSNTLYTIHPFPGASGQTTISNGKSNQETYVAEEIDVIRYEYPEYVEQHKEWPHGYNYLQVLAGENGEHLGNLFLKDYTQYSTQSYYVDTMVIPRSKFASLLRTSPGSSSRSFDFTIKTPPGKGSIELESIVIGYPVLNSNDASTYQPRSSSVPLRVSPGPSPYFATTTSWQNRDPSSSTKPTDPAFQTHHPQSLCGNGIIQGREQCDDGNNVDNDGCSSTCYIEAGWNCRLTSATGPSVCTRLPY
eukprot:48493-Hanusia_phi.AAC.3